MQTGIIFIYFLAPKNKITVLTLISSNSKKMSNLTRFAINTLKFTENYLPRVGPETILINIIDY